MGSKITRCRACGRQVFLCQTTAETSLLCEPQICRFSPTGGPQTFVAMDGRVTRGRIDSFGAVQGYLVHWWMCPKRKEKRR